MQAALQEEPKLLDHADAFDTHVYETEYAFLCMLWFLRRRQRQDPDRRESHDLVQYAIRKYYHRIHPTLTADGASDGAAETA